MKSFRLAVNSSSSVLQVTTSSVRFCVCIFSEMLHRHKKTLPPFTQMVLCSLYAFSFNSILQIFIYQ